MLLQAGLSDIERQAMQQKIQAEIKAKKEKHLTVYQKSSMDREDEDDEAVRHRDLDSVQLGVETNLDYPREERPKARALKSLSLKSEEEDEEDEEDENDAEAAEEVINRKENLKVPKPSSLLSCEEFFV